MEQTTRKRSERAPAEQVEETPETDAERESRLDDLDELLDDIDEILEESDEAADRGRAEQLLALLDLIASDPDALCGSVGLYGPSDLDEAIAADLVSYANELAAQEAAELQAELAKFTTEQNPPCSYCGRCPVLPGCPFQAAGETWYRDFDGTFVHD